MARDVYHEIVKKALETDGWKITHDPLTIDGIGIHPFHIDLAAEKVIAAERDGVKIAVEVKSFIGRSFADDFHDAVGKFINYFVALPKQDPDRMLFLAVRDTIFDIYFNTDHVRSVRELYKIKVVTFNVENQSIVAWIS